MKYWVFDGRDAQGPYDPEELGNLPLFGPETMICPEGTQSPEQWRPAKFYLVRPPGRPAPEIPRPQPRPRQTAVEEPAVEMEAPAVQASPKPAPQPSFPKLNIPPAAAAAAGILLVTLFGWWLSRPKAKPAQTAASAPAAAPALDPQAEAAISLLKSYPMAANKQRLPAAPLEALSPARWSAAVNLGDFYERRALLALSQDALQTVTRQGRSRAEGEKEITRDSTRWERYSQSFLSRHFSQNWAAESAGPGRYAVTARLRYHESAPEQKRRFEVAPSERKLKPLDLDSWFDIDPKAASAWAARNLYLGSMADENAITLRAPDYFWDALKASAAAPSRPSAGKPPKGTAAAVRRAIAPPPDEDEYESVSPEEIERADKGGRAAAAAPAAVPAAKKSAAEVPQMKLPSDAELGARPAPAKPAAAKPAPSEALQPPSGPPAADTAEGKAPDATKMSVDELEKYLGRGKKADAPDKAAPAKPASDDLWEQ